MGTDKKDGKKLYLYSASRWGARNLVAPVWWGLGSINAVDGNPALEMERMAERVARMWSWQRARVGFIHAEGGFGEWA